jgi:hypothetical protein
MLSKSSGEFRYRLWAVATERLCLDLTCFFSKEVFLKDWDYDTAGSMPSRSSAAAIPS